MLARKPRCGKIVPPKQARGVQKPDRARMKAVRHSSGTIRRRDPVSPLSALTSSAAPVRVERECDGRGRSGERRPPSPAGHLAPSGEATAVSEDGPGAVGRGEEGALEG